MNKSYTKKSILCLLILIIVLILLQYKINGVTETFENNNKKTIILHTLKSQFYAKKICKHITNKCITSDKFKIYDIINNLKCDYHNLVIHPRTATPVNALWMNFLYDLEKKGAIIINSPKLLQLTSNKLECSLVLLNADINHPLTWKGIKNDKKTINNIKKLLKQYHKLIIKPFNSISQGAYVQIVKQNMSEDIIKKLVKTIPTDPFVIQEFVNYIAIHRIIVINGKAMPFSFVDKPTPNKWKVSVCLNRDTMKFNPNPDKALLQLAVDTQNVLTSHTKSKYKGIHFIDIFEKENNKFTISEINTACSLLIHENLAKKAGHPKWQISKYIAGYLNSI